MSKSKMSKSKLLDKDVVQANPLIRARKEMSLTEMRLFTLGLQDIKPYITDDVVHDLDFHETKITYTELLKLFGSDHNGNITNLKKQVEKAYDGKIKLSYEDGGFGFRHIYKKMDYIPQEGLTILFDDEIKPYILKIVNQQYTKYKLKAVFALSSVYALRLLETLLENQGFFKQGKKKIYKTLTVEEIRFRLNVGEGLYKGRMNNFKKKVLDEPIEDINQKTDYHVWYDIIKEGRKTTGFTFWLEVNTNTKALPAPMSEEEKLEQEAGQVKLIEPPEPETKPRRLSDEEEEGYYRLINRDVYPKKAEELAKKYEYQIIDRNLKLAVSQKDKSTNLPGLIISMIEQDTAGQLAIARQEAKARDEAKQLDRRQAYDDWHGTHMADIGRARADRAGAEEGQKAPEELSELSDLEVDMIKTHGENTMKPILNRMKKLGLTIEEVKAGKRK